MNISFLKNREILSIDIGSYEIKLIKGRETKKGIIIDDYFSVLTPKNSYYNGEILDKVLLSNSIKEELMDKKIKIKNTYLTINNPFIITREIIIPKVDFGEIKDIIKFQLEDYIPKSPEDYIVQFKIINTVYQENLEKYHVLIIAIPKNIVTSHFELIKDLDLNPLILDYQPNSLAKIIKNNELINDSYPTKGLTFATVDIGYDSTKVSIIKDGIIQVSRLIEIGGKNIDQNILNHFEYREEDLDSNKITSIMKDSFEKLNEKIEMIFRYYSTRGINNEINMILLFGGVVNKEGLTNLYSNYFNIPSIKVESFNNINFNGDIYKYINTIGALIRTKEVNI